MKKLKLLFVYFFIIIFSISADEYNVFFSLEEKTSDLNIHNIEFIRSYDSFEELESYLLFDFIDVSGHPEITSISFFFGYDLLKSYQPEIFMLFLNSSEWYFLTGNVSLKFPLGIIQLSGESDSKMESGANLETSITITKKINDIDSLIDYSSSKEIMMRIFTSEKGNIDIAIPSVYFKKIFSFTKDNIEELKKEKGISK